MRRGFTLLEVIVVLAILAITAGVVAPALFRATRQDDLTHATSEITTLLGRARLAAVERGTPVSVTLTPESGEYAVTIERGDTTALLEEGTLDLDGGVRLVSTVRRPQFRFDPLGTAEGDSVSVLGPTGHRVVALDRWTGEVTRDAR